MTKARPLFLLAATVVLVAASGCKLLNTGDAEQVQGRGATAFDPYLGSNSGAIKLSLQWFKGCSILVNGKTVARGEANVPYPTECDNPLAVGPEHPPRIAPDGKMQLLSDTPYFLNQLTLIDLALNAHTDPEKLSEATQWITRESRFKDLDWANLGPGADDWTMNGNLTWNREVFFENANWMVKDDGEFLIEALDASGQVRASVTYTEREFLGRSPIAGHSRVSWKASNVKPPESPGDNTIRNPPHLMGPPASAFIRTMVRIDLVGSTNPFKTFQVTELDGDGAIRVTWTKLPNKPFIFPVEWVPKESLPKTCFDDNDQPTTCGFGLNPVVKMSTPKNGEFYEPGETAQLIFEVRDADGNRLHPKDTLFSSADMFAEQTNGLLYFHDGHWTLLEEKDMNSAYQAGGPIDDMRVWSDPFGPAPFFNMGQHAFSLVTEAATGRFMAGVYETDWPSRVPLEIPSNAKPGTYVAVLKAHRQFFGERDSKTNAFFFQVGQKEQTSYPNRVGNCQICHRGVLSMENLRHGLGVDHVESCKVCHAVPYDTPGRMEVDIHKIHVRSTRYTEDKSDCTVCHLTRESTLRPSLNACQTCHPSVHGDEYFDTAWTNFETPNRFGNCAQSCHVNSVPQSHILPPN